MKQERKLKFGIPAGTLEESIKKLLKDAGYEYTTSQKPLLFSIDDPEIECFFDRANEIAFLIGKGILDGGIVSKAAIIEAKAKVVKISEIGTPGSEWGRTRVILAMPEKSPIKSPKDLEGKTIITRLPEITGRFLEKNKIKAAIEHSYGSVEAKVPALADALVEFVNTGATLKYHNLKPLVVLLEDANILYAVANPKVLENKWKKEKIENLAMLLKGARLAQEMAGLILHASNDMMEKVFRILPALKKPTVTHLRGENWFDVFSVVNKKKIRELIPQLKEIGCRDIIEFPLNKVVL